MEDFSGALQNCLSLSSSKSLVKQSEQVIGAKQKQYTLLLESGQIPENGWTSLEIESFLLFLSALDSNNFNHNVGVGEREGRLFSELVTRRNYGFAHGVGRSGNLTEIQPKAAGSSILYDLANRFSKHALLLAGFHERTVGKKCTIFPLATGMAMHMIFCALRCVKPKAKYVLWMRIDQKSCLKAITSAGFIPIIVDNKLEGYQIVGNLDCLREKMKFYDPEEILCVVSCSSCFAPRAFDDLVQIGAICKEYNVHHVVNNAYGVQSSRSVHLLNEAVRTGGRLDYFVQSLDKNFMVPVGGSIICSPHKGFVEQVERVYPGRASSSCMIDFVITMLSMGTCGFRKLLEERKRLSEFFKFALERENFQILKSPHNNISIAIKLDDDLTSDIGSMLFLRGASGARVVDKSSAYKEIDGVRLKSFGAHIDDYPHSYLTVAAAIGIKESEIEKFVKMLKRLRAKRAKTVVISS